MAVAAELVALLERGDYGGAYANVLLRVATDSDEAESWHIRGVIEALNHDWDSATRSLQNAVHILPRESSWWRDLGITLLCCANYPDAVAALRHSLDLASDSGAMLYLAEALARQDESVEAIRLISEVRQKAPAVRDQEFKIGRIFEILSRWADAICAYEASLSVSPKHARACERLVDLYRKFHQFDHYQYYAWKLCRISGFHGRSLRLFAIANFALGRLERSLLLHRRLMAQDPLNAEGRSEFLFHLLHDEMESPTTLKREHEDWFRALNHRVEKHKFPNIPDRHRKLRIGVPSGAFVSGPTCMTLLPIFRHHDRQHFELFFYHLTSFRDSATEQYRQTADHWLDLHGCKTSEIRSQILSDKIDIAIDIGGHIYPHALSLFQCHVAPLQVAFPIYPCTTGCKEIDYILTDKRISPGPDYQHQYSEKFTYDLAPGYITFEAPSVQRVTILPALVRKHITFGLFQRPAKYHDTFWDTVALVLHGCGGSKLLIQGSTRDLDNPNSFLRRKYRRKLDERGISEQRVSFVGVKDPVEHLEIVSSIDIALDSWPYNGHTTTCACLWMGVPVVSLAGNTHASRITLAICHHAGLTDWVASTPEEYVAIAIKKANDLQSLSELRQCLRNRMIESPLGQPEVVTRGLEAAYRDIWMRWCSEQQADCRKRDK